jgi:hypothetical protein
VTDIPALVASVRARNEEIYNARRPERDEAQRLATDRAVAGLTYAGSDADRLAEIARSTDEAAAGLAALMAGHSAEALKQALQEHGVDPTDPEMAWLLEDYFRDLLAL